MREWRNCDSRAQHLCDGLLLSLDRRLKELTKVPSSMTVAEKEVTERPIGIMLVIMQRLQALELSPVSQAFLKDGDSHRRRLWATLDITHLWKELLSFVSELQDAPQAALLALRLCPFLQHFHQLANGFLSSLTAWTKSLFKLASILVTLGQNIAENGFCKPEERGDQSTQRDTDMTADGTGVGEGQGEKDISKDIEDESQVEGLQGQENELKDKGDRGEDEDESGLEMDQDFDGELESIQESVEKNSDEDTEEETEEFDEKMDELDPADPEAVDEKMWEDQSTRDDNKENMQSKERSKGDSNPSQMAAKEEESRQQRQITDTPQENEHESPEDNQKNEEDEPDTENLPNEAGAQMDDHIHEEPVLDLPDGLDLELEAETKLSVGDDEGEDPDHSVSEEEVDKDRSRMESEDDDDLSVDGRIETSPGDDAIEQDEVDTPPEMTAKPDESIGEGQTDPQRNPNAPVPIEHGATEGEGEGNQPMDVDNPDSRPEAGLQ
jgi:midasin